MPETIEKFIRFLEKLKKEIAPICFEQASKATVEEKEYILSYLYDKDNVLNNLMRLYSCPKEEWKRINEVFIDFKALSEIIEEILPEMSISDEEIKDVVFYMIEKNIISGVATSSIKISDQKNLLTFPFKGVSASEVHAFITTSALYEAAQKKETELSEKEKVLLREVQRFTEAEEQECPKIQICHKMLKKHYFDKKEVLDFNDVQIILNILGKLGLSKTLLRSISATLRKELRQRKSRLKNIPTQNSSSEEIVEQVQESEAEKSRKKQEENQKRKEEKEIYKKLRDIYNMDEKKLLVIPTNEVVVFWVRNAKKVNLPLETIYDFLRTVDREIGMMDPFVRYGLLYNKLKYFEEKTDISINLEAIEHCIDEFLEYQEYYETLKLEEPLSEKDAKEKEEDKELVRIMQETCAEDLESNLNLYFKLIPKDYTYELSQN